MIIYDFDNKLIKYICCFLGCDINSQRGQEIKDFVRTHDIEEGFKTIDEE